MNAKDEKIIYLFLDITPHMNEKHTQCYVPCHIVNNQISFFKGVLSFFEYCNPSSQSWEMEWEMGIFSVSNFLQLYMYTICYQFVLWQMKQNCLGTDMLHYFSLKTIITHSTYLKKQCVYLMSFFFQIRAFLTNCVQTEIMINKSIASMK